MHIFGNCCSKHDKAAVFSACIQQKLKVQDDMIMLQFSFPAEK